MRAALSLFLIDSSSNPASLSRFQIDSSLRGLCKTLAPGVKDNAPTLGVLGLVIPYKTLDYRPPSSHFLYHALRRRFFSHFLLLSISLFLCVSL
uniref:Uncharacterized protein n=1 Tax=Rhizophora mucronata TaxID=61149 RepID=A0A2P2KL90_RHIMU